MWIFLFLFSMPSFSEENASEKYCFTSDRVARVAERKLKAIQVPSDLVTPDQNCLVVQMRPHRRELIQRFLRSSFPDLQVAFSSEEVRRESCLIKVEKVKTAREKNRNLGGRETISAGERTSTQDGKETFQIQTMKEFELSVDENEVKGQCRFINKDRYHIKLSVRKKAMPVVPENLPSGTVVVLNSPPPEQQTSSLQTELELNRGERIEVGSIIRKLKEESRAVKVDPELKWESTSEVGKESVYLEIY